MKEIKWIKKSNFLRQRIFLTDLVIKIAMVFLLIYAIFFCAETVLPGLIVSIFNFNWLLVAALGLLIIFLSISSDFFFKRRLKLSKSQMSQYPKGLILVVIVLLLITLFFALYKVSLEQRIVYLVGISGLFFLMKNLLELNQDAKFKNSKNLSLKKENK
ncbi:MAG TPA: hypothetical protein GX706_00830 [Candidatus Moranbacteria bacterium]|nr:hypothetical protein [Candidatus Moranbacteria bacterium]